LLSSHQEGCKATIEKKSAKIAELRKTRLSHAVLAVKYAEYADDGRLIQVDDSEDVLSVDQMNALNN